MISRSQVPLPDNTQHSQGTDIHVPGAATGIGIHRRISDVIESVCRGNTIKAGNE